MNTMKTVLQLSAYASAMIILILSLKAIFKEKINLKIIIFLWALVLIRLLIPYTFDAPLHFDSLLPEEAAAETQTAVYQQETAADNNDEANAIYPANMTLPDYYTDNDAQAGADTQPNAQPESPSVFEEAFSSIKSINISTYLMGIWIIGMLVILLKSILNYYRFNKMIIQCLTVRDADINEMVSELKNMLGIQQSVHVIVSRYVTSPMTFKLLRPVIIIPISLTTRISKQKLKMVLLHEFCHIKRKDILFNILWMAAKTVHWFNPFVWIAYNNYIEDIELACDEMVNSYLDDEQSFVYSQSLIDVIRFSKNIVKLPAAMSFCQDKSKLRKRVENMLKPQRKLKSAGAISLFLAVTMIITCFTTACQPTPETIIVQNKNDGELEAAIMETAAPEVPQSTENPIEENRIIRQISNETGEINISVDARVLQEGDENVTIARIENYIYTEEEMARVTEIFFGGNVTYYDTLTTTKQDYEDNIIFLQQRLTLDDDELRRLYEDKEIYDINEIKAHINNVIEELKQRAADAPEAGGVIEKFESRTQEWGGFYADVEYGKDFLGHVSYNDPFTGRVTFGCTANINETISDMVQIDTETLVNMNAESGTEYDLAKQTAQKFIQDIGMQGVEIGDVFVSTINTKNLAGETTATEEKAYIFCFERVVGERTIDYTLFDGGYTDDNEVTKTVPYEIIKVRVKGTELSSFTWNNPHRVTEIINDNAAIQVDYEQALELAVNQIFAKYAYFLDQGHVENVFAEITSIEFEMVRMKEKNTDNYISVPAWKIYGEVLMKRTQETSDALTNMTEEEIDVSEYESLTKWDGPNIVTINALDGTVIDMHKGY